MLELRIDVETHAVKAHPAADAHADARDLGAAHEDADRAFAPLAFDAEGGERSDQPILEPGDESADVAAAGCEIEHHIDHALARPMIGETAAAPGAVNGKARGLEELGLLGAGARGIDGRVLQQPDA